MYWIIDMSELKFYCRVFPKSSHTNQSTNYFVQHIYICIYLFILKLVELQKELANEVYLKENKKNCGRHIRRKHNSSDNFYHRIIKCNVHICQASVLIVDKDAKVDDDNNMKLILRKNKKTSLF